MNRNFNRKTVIWNVHLATQCLFKTKRERERERKKREKQQKNQLASYALALYSLKLNNLEKVKIEPGSIFRILNEGSVNFYMLLENVLKLICRYYELKHKAIISCMAWNEDPNTTSTTAKGTPTENEPGKNKSKCLCVCVWDWQCRCCERKQDCLA